MKQNLSKQYIVVGGILLVILVTAILSHGMKTEQETSRKIPETQMQTETTESEETEKISESAVQIVTPGSNPNIRVQICAGDYADKYHDNVRFVCSTDYIVSYGDVSEEHAAAEPVWFTPDDPWFAKGAVTLTPKDAKGTFTMPELKRTQKAPTYEGSFTIENTDQGILVVNELPLETYLYSVVPSEMPSTYPLEALKAQAVCARTYALKHVQEGKKDGKSADVDDSVSFQVYNNIVRSEQTDQAVNETKGQVLMQGESLIDALYYSTSCGIDLSSDYSEDAVFCAFMGDAKQKSYEQEEVWYRWSTYYSLEELTRLAKFGISDELGTVKSISVLQRDSHGAVTQLQVEGEQNQVVIEGEYQIRKFLQTDQVGVTLQNGKQAPELGMLPSAFFYLTADDEAAPSGYQVTGGGYGHGKGLSQNGARHMAEAGKTCKEILNYYYG